ncbi:MAG: TadE/TadG family type IV pilus assembly protein [Blautia sp.]
MQKNREGGALTVEAVIFTTLFVVFFISLMNLVNVVRVQSLLQYGVTQTARELSQYSYILTKTGVVRASNQTYIKAKGFKDDVDSVANDLTQISSAISDVAAGGDIQSNIDTIIDASNNGIDTLDTYFENPENILAGALAVGKDHLQGTAKTAVISAITKNRMKAFLSANGADPDERLKNLGVEGGLDGLDFSESKWFSEGNQDLYIIVKYKMKIKFMFLEQELPEFKVCGATRIW